MPIFINKLKSSKFNPLYQNLLQYPLYNMGMYLNFKQRAHKSGLWARPKYNVRSTDPASDKAELSVSTDKNIIGYKDPRTWDKYISELTDLSGAPSYEEIATQIYGTSPGNFIRAVDFTDPGEDLILTKKGKPNVRAGGFDLDSIPKAILGGEIAYAVLSQTEEEHNSRLKTVNRHISEFRKIGIVEDSGRMRQYTCAYSGQVGRVTTSEILITFPALAEKCMGKSQYEKNFAVFNFLTKAFTPGNNANAVFLNPETDEPQHFLEWTNRKEGEKKDGTAVEGVFSISAAYSAHVANAISFKLLNGRTILLFTEAEMSKKYMVINEDGDWEEYRGQQIPLQAQNIVSRMHRKPFIRTEENWGADNLYEESEIQELINKNVFPSAAMLYFVEHKLPNPIAAFGIANYMTCGSGMPIGPYIGEEGEAGEGSSCITLNQTFYVAGGGKLSDLYLGVSEDNINIAAGGKKDFAPYFVDAYIRAIKGTIKTVYTYGGTIGDYVKFKKDVKAGKGGKNAKELLEERKIAARNDILFGTPVERKREILDKGMKLHVDDDATLRPSEQFVYLAVNSITFLEYLNRLHEVLEDYKSLSDEERKLEDPEFLEMVDRVCSAPRSKSESSIVRVLSNRNRLNLCTAASILAHGISSESGNDEENLTLKMISGDAMFIAEEVIKGKTPDMSELHGKLPPKE